MTDKSKIVTIDEAAAVRRDLLLGSTLAKYNAAIIRVCQLPYRSGDNPNDADFSVHAKIMHSMFLNTLWNNEGLKRALVLIPAGIESHQREELPKTTDTLLTSWDEIKHNAESYPVKIDIVNSFEALVSKLISSPSRYYDVCAVYDATSELAHSEISISQVLNIAATVQPGMFTLLGLRTREATTLYRKFGHLNILDMTLECVCDGVALLRAGDDALLTTVVAQTTESGYYAFESREDLLASGPVALVDILHDKKAIVNVSNVAVVTFEMADSAGPGGRVGCINVDGTKYFVKREQLDHYRTAFASAMTRQARP
jgi:hypothetical protein